MDDKETISVNDFVESLPTENRKNYPIQLESSNKKVAVIRDRYTILNWSLGLSSLSGCTEPHNESVEENMEKGSDSESDYKSVNRYIASLTDS